MDATWNRIRTLDRGQDVIPIHESSGVACFMKLFPSCATPLGADDDYRRFHLRFYVPLDILLDPGRRADRLFVMTNGLDEFQHFALYDDLGMRLAANGVPCVLLPLPDHLNRHTVHRIPQPTFAQVVTRPSEVLRAEPISHYHRYLQFKAELKTLREHIHGSECTERARGACSIYRKLFSNSARISYLGYSLGACGMLADFLQNQQELTSCVLLSGAINLKDIVSEKLMPQPEWDDFIGGLSAAFRGQRSQKAEAATLADDLFEEVFLGAYGARSQSLLKEHGRRVLFILGGRDKLISPSNFQVLAPKDWGLGLFVLPGINHFLPVDEEWRRWRSLVVHLVTRFEMNAGHRPYTERDLIEAAAEQRRTSKSKEPAPSEVLERARCVGWDPGSIAGEIKASNEIREIAKKLPYHELKLGLRLVKAGLIGSGELRMVLMEHERTGVRVGDVVVDVLKLVRREVVEALVRAV